MYDGCRTSNRFRICIPSKAAVCTLKRLSRRLKWYCNGFPKRSTIIYRESRTTPDAHSLGNLALLAMTESTVTSFWIVAPALPSLSSILTAARCPVFRFTAVVETVSKVDWRPFKSNAQAHLRRQPCSYPCRSFFAFETVKVVPSLRDDAQSVKICSRIHCLPL